MTLSATSAKSTAVLANANAILLKAGFNPSQMRADDGKWTDGGSLGSGMSGGGGRGPTTGAETRGYPYGPSRKELEMENEHSRLIGDMRAMQRGGVSARDADYMDLEQKIHESAIKLRAKKAERMAELARRRAAEQHQRPEAANAAANEQQARADRRSEAERIQAAMNRNRQQSGGTGRDGLSDKDRDLLNEINALGAKAGAAVSAASVAATLVGGGPGTFRGALSTATGRLYRSIRQVNNIVGNTHGIVTTSDYVQIGRHLNFIRDDISALQHEIKQIPADARELRHQTSIKLKQARAKVASLQQKVKAKLSRKKD